MGSDQQEVACTTNNNGSIYRILFDGKQCQVAAAKALLSVYLIESKDLEIGECVGQGSSGEVYKGIYKGQDVAVKVLKGTMSTSQDVAVKVLKGTMSTSRNTEFISKSDSDFPPGESEEEVFRMNIEGQFRREVLGLISCPHQNILKIYGVCLSSQFGICIVTKFMRGGTLLQYLQQRTTGLRLSEILKLAKDVAKGMEYLHSRGIVHMDLKTANVFLDEEGIAVIGDLGVARLVNEEGQGREIGSYRWMAPEVCGVESGRGANNGGGGFSYKSDVYSYGILVWELVTCKIPFSDYSPVQAAVGVVMHGLRPPIPSSCFPPLRYLIKKCWDQNPTVRPHFSHILGMLNIISQQDWS